MPGSQWTGRVSGTANGTYGIGYQLYKHDGNYDKGSLTVKNGMTFKNANANDPENARFLNFVKTGEQEGEDLYQTNILTPEQEMYKNYAAITNQLNQEMYQLYKAGYITEKVGDGRTFDDSEDIAFEAGKTTNAEKANAAKLLESWFKKGLVLPPSNRTQRKGDNWRKMQTGDHIQLSAAQKEAYWEALGFTRQKAATEQKIDLKPIEGIGISPVDINLPGQLPKIDTKPVDLTVKNAQDIPEVTDARLLKKIQDLGLAEGDYCAHMVGDFTTDSEKRVESGTIAIKKGNGTTKAHDMDDSTAKVYKFHYENGKLVFETTEDGQTVVYKEEAKRFAGIKVGLLGGHKLVRQGTQATAAEASVQNTVVKGTEESDDAAAATTTAPRAEAKRDNETNIFAPVNNRPGLVGENRVEIADAEGKPVTARLTYISNGQGKSGYYKVEYLKTDGNTYTTDKSKGDKGFGYYPANGAEMIVAGRTFAAPNWDTKLDRNGNLKPKK